MRELLDQARQAKDGENNSDNDKAGQDDDNTEESVENTLGGFGDFFRVAGAGDIGPGGLEEAKKKNGAGKEEDKGDDLDVGEEIADIAGGDFPTRRGEVADFDVFHFLYSSPGRARILMPIRFIRKMARIMKTRPATAEEMISLPWLSLSGMPAEVVTMKTP